MSLNKRDNLILVFFPDANETKAFILKRFSLPLNLSVAVGAVCVGAMCVCVRVRMFVCQRR